MRISDWSSDVCSSDLVSIALARQACLQKMGIDVSYVSLTSGETKRTLFPHALVRTAERWHVRAWCPEREEYRDFNVGRMSKMTVSKADRDTNLPEDSAWNEYVSLRIRSEEHTSELQSLMRISY